jgi:hypothetical protein
VLDIDKSFFTMVSRVNLTAGQYSVFRVYLVDRFYQGITNLTAAGVDLN